MATTTITHHSQVLPPAVNRGPFSSLAEQLLAVRQASLRASQSGYVDPRLYQINERFHDKRAAPAGAAELAPSLGGFAVQSEFSRELAVRTFAQGELLSRMTTYPLTKQFATGLKVPGFDEQSRASNSRFGGMRSAWENEADTAAVSKIKYRQIELSLHKLIGVVYCTDELVQDAAALEKAMVTAFVNEFCWKLEYSALFGTGAGQPLGVFNPANVSAIVVAKQSGQATGTIVYQNVVNMLASMWGPSQPNAIWLVSESVFPQLLALTIPVGTSGGSEIPLYKPAVLGERWGRLLGAPCVVSEYASALTSLGDLMLIDASQIIFVQKEDITPDISIFVNFLTDEQVFRFTWRVDTQPAWHTTLLPANGSTAALSPFVVLAPR